MAQIWFKFWAKEYLSDSKVRCLSYEERGILQTLWAFAWEEGSLPNDPKLIANMLGIGVKSFPKIDRCLGMFFVPHPAHPSRLVSPRLELERDEADAKGSRARESAQARWSKRNADAMRTHSERNADGDANAMRMGMRMPCESHAGQGQGQGTEQTTPLTPQGELGVVAKTRKPRKSKNGLDPLADTPGAEEWFDKAMAKWPAKNHDGSATPYTATFKAKTLFACVCKRDKVEPIQLAFAINAYIEQQTHSRRFFHALSTVLGPSQQIVKDFYDKGNERLAQWRSANHEVTDGE